MHEQSLMQDLVYKAESVVRSAGGTGASRVIVRRGALSHMSPEHLESHFELIVAGTLLAGSRLEIEDGDDLADPGAMDLVLKAVEVVGGAS
jgi:hydrogenase nickel incorporation protein HypA/HybF